MRIKPVFFGVIVLATFLGTIYGFQAAGIWSVSGKIARDGAAVQPLAEDVNTIKGWMTLEQITTVYAAPLSELLAHFNLPAGTPASTAIKDLESDEFSVTNLRAWLVSRAESIQPEPAVLPTETVIPTPTVTASEPAATAVPTEHAAPVKMVTGKTTFQDLLDWGVAEATIQQIIGSELPAPATTIKDFVTQNGSEFAPVKTALQAEVDKTK